MRSIEPEKSSGRVAGWLSTCCCMLNIGPVSQHRFYISTRHMLRRKFGLYQHIQYVGSHEVMLLHFYVSTHTSASQHTANTVPAHFRLCVLPHRMRNVLAPRWFEPRLARWGVEPHRVAEARGETPVAGQLSDACVHRLVSSSSSTADARLSRLSHARHLRFI